MVFFWLNIAHGTTNKFMIEQHIRYYKLIATCILKLSVTWERSHHSYAAMHNNLTILYQLSLNMIKLFKY